VFIIFFVALLLQPLNLLIMKKILTIFTLTILFFGLSSFTSTTVFEKKNKTTYDTVLVDAWQGTLFGIDAYFSSRSCAKDAGATNIFYVGLKPSKLVLTCL
jgi:hypothetical protein